MIPRWPCHRGAVRVVASLSSSAPHSSLAQSSVLGAHTSIFGFRSCSRYFSPHRPPSAGRHGGAFNPRLLSLTVVSIPSRSSPIQPTTSQITTRHVCPSRCPALLCRGHRLLHDIQTSSIVTPRSPPGEKWDPGPSTSIYGRSPTTLA